MDERYREGGYAISRVTAGRLQLIKRMQAENRWYERVDEIALGDAGAQNLGKLVDLRPFGNAQSTQGKFAQRTRMVGCRGPLVAIHGLFGIAQSPKRFASVVQRLRVVRGA